VEDPHLPDAERGAACWLASGVAAPAAAQAR